jgi:DNA polymerase elongation subunit (family B)
MEQTKTMESQENQARILSFDLEVSPAIGWYYPPTWETNILEWEQRQKLMSFAWQWVYPDGTYSKAESKCLYDMPGYKVDKQNDLLLSKELHNLLNEANILMGHNSDNFDIKMANYFFLMNKLGPVHRVQTIDTKKMAKMFRMNNNTLNNVAKELGHEGKTKVKHADIWRECFVDGDKESWNLMCVYNERDVEETTLAYLDMRPFMHNHPNIARIAGLEYVCPTCLSTEYKNDGHRYTGISKIRRFVCSRCHRGFTERTAVKQDSTNFKPVFNNA